MIQIWTDGACSGNPGPGGWAAIIKTPVQEKIIFGGSEDTTNNRMELTAVIEALSLFKSKCTITLFSDSEYVTKGFTDGRVAKWKSKNWLGVKNVDLWQKLDQLNELHNITWMHIRGHGFDENNNKCDLIAKSQIVKK